LSAASRPEAAGICPVSGTVGQNVGLLTLKALLTGKALRRLDGIAYRFCAEPDCDVVYFDRDAGSIFDKSDLGVRVGLKESSDPIPICYCFDVTVSDLRTGTDVAAMIGAEVRAGHCACEVKNPQGSCCLGNVSAALARLRAAGSV